MSQLAQLKDRTGWIARYKRDNSVVEANDPNQMAAVMETRDVPDEEASRAYDAALEGEVKRLEGLVAEDVGGAVEQAFKPAAGESKTDFLARKHSALNTLRGEEDLPPAPLPQSDLIRAAFEDVPRGTLDERGHAAQVTAYLNEKLGKHGLGQFRRTVQPPMGLVEETARSLGRGAVQSAEGLAAGIPRVIGAAAGMAGFPMQAAGANAVADAAAGYFDQAGPIVDPSQEAQQIGALPGSLGEVPRWMAAQAPAALVQGVTSFAPGFAGAGAVRALGGGAQLAKAAGVIGAVAGNTGAEAEGAYQEVSKLGGTNQQAQAAALAYGLASSALEFIPAAELFLREPKSKAALLRAIRQASIEATTEMGQEGAQALINYQATGDDRALQDVGKRIAAAGVLSLLPGGVLGAAVHGEQVTAPTENESQLRLTPEQQAMQAQLLEMVRGRGTDLKVTPEVAAATAARDAQSPEQADAEIMRLRRGLETVQPSPPPPPAPPAPLPASETIGTAEQGDIDRRLQQQLAAEGADVQGLTEDRILALEISRRIEQEKADKAKAGEARAAQNNLLPDEWFGRARVAFALGREIGQTGAELNRRIADPVKDAALRRGWEDGRADFERQQAQAQTPPAPAEVPAPQGEPGGTGSQVAPEVDPLAERGSTIVSPNGAVALTRAGSAIVELRIDRKIADQFTGDPALREATGNAPARAKGSDIVLRIPVARAPAVRAALEAKGVQFSAKQGGDGFLSTLSPLKQRLAENLNRQLTDKTRNTLRAGFDPEMMAIAVRLGALYAEAGARKFAQWAKIMHERLGDAVKPHLKDIYEQVRARTEAAKFRGQMDDSNAVKAADVDAIAAGPSGKKPLGSFANPGPGRPDLANPGKSGSPIVGEKGTETAGKAVKAVDTYRNESGQPEVRPDTVVGDQARERLKDYEGEKKKLLDLATSAAMLSDVDTAVARTIIAREGVKMALSKNATDRTQFMALVQAYRESRANVGRALRAGRDSFGSGLTPREHAMAQIAEALGTPSPSEARKIARWREAARNAGTPEERKILTRKAEALANLAAERGKSKIIKRLAAYGIDLENLTDEQLADRRTLALIGRTIAGAKSLPGEWLHEWFVSALVSAPKSQTANVIGNSGMLMWESTAQRLAEAMVNLVVRDAGAAQLGEFKWALKGLLPALSRAVRNGWLAFDIEGPVMEDELGIADGSKVELRRRGSIPSIPIKIGGKTLEVGGRQARLPLRMLGGMDELFKGFAGTIEAFEQAYRRGKAQKLEGAELAKFIDSELADLASDSWRSAVGYAERVTFQDEPTALGRTIQNARETIPASWLIVPFVKTVDRLMATGIRKTPLGTLNMLHKFHKYGTLYPRGELVRDSAEQLLGFGLMFGLLGLMGGKDDEPWITGSTGLTLPQAGQEAAARALTARTVPPQSVRIGDKWISYARLDPFAVSIAMVADGWDAFNRVEKGDKPVKQLASAYQRLLSLIENKSYLRGVSDLLYAIEEGDYAGLATNIATGFVPNIVRGGAREADPFVREQRVWGEFGKDKGGKLAAKFLYAAFPSRGNAEEQGIKPKVDLWGNEVKRQDLPHPLTDWLYRMSVPADLVDATKVDPLDRAILNWNNEHPDDVYAPAEPAPYFEVPKQDGSRERVYMTREEYHDFVAESGKLAHDVLQEAKIDPEKPTRADIETIKTVLSKTRRYTLIKQFGDRFREEIQEP